MRDKRSCALLVLAGCAIGGDASDPSFHQTLGGTASINLSGSSATMTQTSNTAWTLSKTGSVNASTQTVTWTVTATQGSTTSGLLIINGTMTVTNTGTGGATIGNVVVNLQKKSGSSWVTKASDVADATADDAATTANVMASASSENKSSFSEGAGSGQLLFTDAQTNSVFSLVPQVTIPAGATRTLLFSATFNNNVLALPAGTATRAEVIVSFGNASSGGSAPNIDINGNGMIDPDEARVRSVPTRIGLTVPPQVPGNAMVTLTDTLADITKTGTVTFSNAQFNLGPTGGTVRVSFNGGASGGTLTNCAHLTGQSQSANSGGHQFPTVLGVNLTACNTVAIGPHTCTPGAPGCGWENGDMTTFAQDAWGAPGSTAAGLLISNFDTLYPNPLEVGIAGAAGFSMRFFDSLAVLDYLPAAGPPDRLSADLIDPGSSASGVFGGNVLALQINVDFSDAGVLSGSSRFGDLLLCNFTALPALNGMTVRQFLGAVNSLLGGGSGPASIDDLDPITLELTRAFLGGAPSTFAQQHVFAGSCPV